MWVVLAMTNKKIFLEHTKWSLSVITIPGSLLSLNTCTCPHAWGTCPGQSRPCPWLPPPQRPTTTRRASCSPRCCPRTSCTRPGWGTSSSWHRLIQAQDKCCKMLMIIITWVLIMNCYKSTDLKLLITSRPAKEGFPLLVWDRERINLTTKMIRLSMNKPLLHQISK